MYKVLKRSSLGISEHAVFLLLKSYLSCLVANHKDMFRKADHNCILTLFEDIVDFSKLSLQEVLQIEEMNWFPKGVLKVLNFYIKFVKF